MPRWMAMCVFIIFLVCVCTALWHRYKSLPEGLSVESPARPAENITLLTDATWATPQGQRQESHHIFDAYFALIDQASQLIVVDMFLWNQTAQSDTNRPLAQHLAERLIAKREQYPSMTIIVITDPINTLYGGMKNPLFTRLENAGIPVLMTPLKTLRDSNPSWSGVWRVCCGWLGNRDDKGALPNPLDSGNTTLRSYLALANFKANHRKTLVVDDGDTLTALVSSANAHDASSHHSNIGLRFSGAAAFDVLTSELAVARLADPTLDVSLPDELALESLLARGTRHDKKPSATLQVITESKIRDAVLRAINNTQAGDAIDLMMFYLSHRDIVHALLNAHQRGVAVRVLLDPNKDAFGIEKNGIPNRQVAAELHNAGIAVRWCDTRGEQCHSKALLVHRQQEDTPQSSALILGSANFTRRNLDDFNLESNVHVEAAREHAAIQHAEQFFERYWHNENDQHYSVDYGIYADNSVIKKGIYRFMEFSGWSSF